MQAMGGMASLGTPLWASVSLWGRKNQPQARVEPRCTPGEKGECWVAAGRPRSSTMLVPAEPSLKEGSTVPQATPWRRRFPTAVSPTKATASRGALCPHLALLGTGALPHPPPLPSEEGAGVLGRGSGGARKLGQWLLSSGLIGVAGGTPGQGVTAESLGLAAPLPATHRSSLPWVHTAQELPLDCSNPITNSPRPALELSVTPSLFFPHLKARTQRLQLTAGPRAFAQLASA